MTSAVCNRFRVRGISPTKALNTLSRVIRKAVRKGSLYCVIQKAINIIQKQSISQSCHLEGALYHVVWKAVYIVSGKEVYIMSFRRRCISFKSSLYHILQKAADIVQGSYIIINFVLLISTIFEHKSSSCS